MSEVYDNEVIPLIKSLKLICSQNKIPMFLTLYDDNEYKNEMISPESHGIEIETNLFPDLINVIVGYKPKEEKFSIENDFFSNII